MKRWASSVRFAKRLGNAGAIAAGLFLVASAGAADDANAPAMDHSHHHHDMAGTDAHAGHEGHDMSAMQETKRSQGSYAIPTVKMTRQNGTQVELARALDDGRPVVLNFVYTSCTAICPVTTQILADFREKLGTESKAVNVVSISIDPDYDTPERLAAYASRFDADSGWSFYTGTLKDSIAVQKAFNTYRGDKMNHAPVTFMRAAKSRDWVRIEGFASADTLLAEFRKIGKKS